MISNRLDTKVEVRMEVEQLRRNATESGENEGSGRGPSSELGAMLRKNQQSEDEMLRRKRQAILQARKEEALRKDVDRRTRKKPAGSERFVLFALANRKRPSEMSSNESPMVVFDQDPNFDFAAVRGHSVPFHVFDVDSSETILVELSGDELARVRKQGEQWAWIQLDSGLMGLVRNHHVRQASEFEVLKYLALEYAEKVEDGEVSNGGPIKVSQVDGNFQVTRAGEEEPPVPEMTGRTGDEENDDGKKGLLDLINLR